MTNSGTMTNTLIDSAKTIVHRHQVYAGEKWNIIQQKLRSLFDAAYHFALRHHPSGTFLSLSGRISFPRLLYLATLLVKNRTDNTSHVSNVRPKKIVHRANRANSNDSMAPRIPRKSLNHNVINEDKGRSEKDVSLEMLSTATESNGRYWFFANGTVRPERYDPSSNKSKPKIWPHESLGDRIVDQLMYIPPDYDSENVKTILLPNKWAAWNVPIGMHAFHVCPVNACNLTDDVSQIEDADVVMFRDTISVTKINRSSNQIWIIFVMDSAAKILVRNFGDINGSNEVNWTATYRMDSDIVTPYGKWLYYNDAVRTLRRNKMINFAAKKRSQVAWFVSNCEAANDRLEYAQELQRYITVDVYGKCGELDCPIKTYSTECFDLLNKRYKFYLSFESANCVDYVTEKLFINGLGNNIIPIVMGAPKEFYERIAPSHSFIHVDDFPTPEELAQYLHLLDKNDTLYNSYFQWKGTGEVIDTFFWCRLCTMVHDAHQSRIRGKYPDIEEWWEPGENCREESWKYLTNSWNEGPVITKL